MQVTPTPNTAQPWSILESKQLLVRSARHTAPLASELDDATRAGLADAVRHVEAGGGSFEVARSWTEKVLGDAYRSLDAAQVVDFIASQPLPFKTPLFVNIDGRAHVPVTDLTQLRALEVACRVAAAGGNDPVGRAVAHVLAQGWTLLSDDRANGIRATPGPFAATAALNRYDEVQATPPAGSAKEAWGVNSVDDLLALDFFECGGSSEGLVKPAQAEALKALEAAGYRFVSTQYLAGDLPAHNAYMFWAPIMVGRAGNVKVPVEEADLQDLPRLEQRIAACTSLYERFGKPVLDRQKYEPGRHEATSRDAARNHWMQSVLDEKICPTLSMEARAEVLSALMDVGAPVVDDLHALAGRIADPALLREEALWLARLRSAAGTTDGGALAVLDKVRDHLDEEAVDVAGQFEVRNDLLRLTVATGNISSAVEALELVRLPGGAESRAQRMAAVEHLAALVPERRADASGDLKTILLHRLPGDSIEAEVLRFSVVQMAAGASKQPDRVRAVFTRLQETVRAVGGDPQMADDAARRLGEAVALSSDLDRALTVSLQPHKAPASGDVRVETDGTLVVGGVRVPVRSGDLDR